MPQSERETSRQKAEGRKKTFGGRFIGIFLLAAFCLLPTAFPAFAWEHPLVNRFKEAQEKEKELFSVLPELKGYPVRSPSASAAQSSLRNLTAVKSAGSPALVSFYESLLSFWSGNKAKAEVSLELAKNQAKEDVGALWLMVQRSYRGGWGEAALKLTDQVRESAKDAGFKDLNLYAQTLLLFAQEKAQEGDEAASQEWLRKAESLSPHIPEMYFTQARLSLKKGFGGLPAALKALAAGYSAGLRNPWTVMSWKAHIFYTLHWALIFLFLFVVLGLFLKNTPLILHDVEEFIIRGQTSQVIIALTLLMLFVPLLLGFGLLCQGLFWFLLFFPYAKLREKIWCALLALLLLAAPILLSQASSLTAFFASPRSRLLVTAQESGYDAGLLKELKTLKSQEARNPLIPYLMGLLHYRGGDFPAAEKEFKETLSLNPRWYAAMVNLGNVYFGMNSSEQAARQYQNALDLNANIASAHYNISQIYTAQLKITEAGAEYDKAGKIDPDLVASYEQSISPNPNRRLMEQRLGSADFLAGALPPAEEVKRLTQNLWSGRLWRVPLTIAPLVLLGVVIVALASFFIRGRGAAQYCQKCGQPFCLKCHPQQRGERYCQPCNAIFIRKDAVVVKLKVERQIETQKYQQRRRLYARVLNLVLPGMGQLYWGESLKGLIYGSLAVTAAVVFLLPAPAYLPPWTGEPYTWRAAMGGGVLGLLYLIVQVDLHFRMKVR